MHIIGRIDIEKYQGVTEKRIITDQVVLTDNRIQHIIERRGQEFYDEYKDRFADIVENPDYVFNDKNKNTAIAAKTFSYNSKTVNVVIKIVVEGDNPEYKNSIITAIIENDKRFAQRLRNNNPIYRCGHLANIMV